MQMEMKHLLPASQIIVLTEADAVSCERLFERAGHARGHLENRSSKVIGQLIRIRNMVLWHDQAMAKLNRSVWTKHHKLIGTEYDWVWQMADSNTTEDAIVCATRAGSARQRLGFLSADGYKDIWPIRGQPSAGQMADIIE
jgi:hypothetical protein